MKSIIFFIASIFFTILLNGQVAMEVISLAEGSSQIRLRANGTNDGFGIRMNNDGILRFMANDDTEAMQIDDDTGRIGIGTNSLTNDQLRVKMDEESDDTRYGICSLVTGVGLGSRFGVFGQVDNNNSGNRYGLYGSATTIGDGSWAVYANGDFYYTGDFTATSDGRYKSGIRKLESSLDMVMRLAPRRYMFNHDVKGLNLAQGQQIGFVAQELEKILPELVKTNMHDVFEDPNSTISKKVEIKSINYLGLIPVLTKALQEQQETILRLEKRVAELERAG